MPIISTFYEKKNLDKYCPYNVLEHDISIMRNVGNILLLGDFNTRKKTNYAIILSKDSNSNPLWLDDDFILARDTKEALKTWVKICSFLN